MKKLLVSLSIASLLSVSSYAINAKERDHHGAQDRMAMKSLNLSAQQKQDIKQIRKETMQDLSVYKGERKQFRESMRDLMVSEIWNEAAVRAAIDEQMTAQLQSKLIKAKSKNKVFNQFNEQQKSQFIAKRWDKEKGKGDRKSKGAEKKVQRLTKVLALSVEQQAQLTAMMETNKTLRQANREQASSLRTQLANIVQAPDFDENTWLAIHSDNKQQKLDMTVTKAKARFDMLSVLNEEQREKFAKVMSKSKKGKMNKKNKMRKNSKRAGDKGRSSES
ncbi:MAG: protein CpxP [Glaciecola sp.]|jgi:protein CpxP